MKKTIQLWPAELERLEAIAAELGALAKAGPNYGQPSGHSLVRQIARGNLLVADPDKLRGLFEAVRNGTSTPTEAVVTLRVVDPVDLRPQE